MNAVNNRPHPEEHRQARLAVRDAALRRLLTMRGREIELQREVDEPYFAAVLMRNWRARVRMAFSRSVCVAGATAVSAQAPPVS